MPIGRRFITMLLGALLSLAACTPVEEDAQKTYRHALDGAPGSLDPAHAGDIYASALVVNLYDTLFRYKYLERPYELTTSLAREMPEVSGDGLVWTIRLRDDARFVDDPAFPEGRGRPVTAEDVVYSLRRHFDPATRSQGTWLWRGRIRGLDEWGRDGADPQATIEGLRALDETTLRIELTEPYPQLPYTLATALSAIVPREAVEHHGREFGIRPVGSGPFRLVSFDETAAVLEPNPSFDRPALDLQAEGYDSDRHQHLGLDELDGRDYPFVDRLEIHFIGEPTARWSSFASGGVDTVMLPPRQADRVIASTEPLTFRDDIRQRYHVRAGEEAGFVFFGFNMANPDIGHHENPDRSRRNRALRCAMRDAYDWEARSHVFHHGMATAFPGVIPPFLPEYDETLDRQSVRHNPQAARQRLEQHGWDDENLPRMAYGFESSVEQRQIFDQFRAFMDEAAIPADRLRARSFASFGEYNRAINNGLLDIFLLGWTMAFPDAQYNLQLFYGPNAAPGANSFSYRNDEFDRLFERASRLAAGPERTELYRRLNRKIIDDCVIIGSLSRQRIHLWHKHVRMLPDREMLGGHFMRFVDIGDRAE